MLGSCRGLAEWPALVVCLAAILGSIAATRADIMGDECDWFGSGSSATSGSARSVTPVYLRCAQGGVTWNYPRGALRVVLRLGATGRDFRGCLKADKAFAGARVFLEGRRSLAKLHDGDDAMVPSELPRCFTSRDGQAAIYVEATAPSNELARRTAAFTYDLEPLPRDGRPFDPSEECRPCSEEELARAYCTSDLVVRGIITSLENLDALHVSRLRVSVTKSLRHSTAENAANLVDDAERQVEMFRSRSCGAKHGPGEYVFMARRRLGELTLTCAPRLEDWAHVRRTINREGKAHCKLKS